MTQQPKSALTPIDQALDRLLASLRPIEERETVPILGARGRILAAAIEAAMDVPPHDNSAMDGYAVRALDTADRSEERRVGKECRSRWSPYP